MSLEASYEYTSVVNPIPNVSLGVSVMVVEPMLIEVVGVCDAGALVAVVQVRPAAPVVQVVQAAGESETQTVRGILLEARVLSLNAPSMAWADLKGFMCDRMSLQTLWLCREVG